MTFASHVKKMNWNTLVRKKKTTVPYQQKQVFNTRKGFSETINGKTSLATLWKEEMLHFGDC